MKNFLFSLVAVAALSLGGLFTASAAAQAPFHHHHHNHHHGGYAPYSSPYQQSYYRPYSYGYGGYGGYAPNCYVQPYQTYLPYQQNSFYLQGRNFGIGFGY